MHPLREPVQQSISLNVFYRDCLKDIEHNSLEFTYTDSFNGSVNVKVGAADFNGTPGEWCFNLK